MIPNWAQSCSFVRRVHRRGFPWLVFCLAPWLLAQDAQQDLTQLTLEQLSKVEVTSVSKKEQRLSDTAGAVFVITHQDIRNTPATNIPELLRMAPGLQVAQINGYQWAISARGFAEQYANKMLVLVDGRSVFDPLFSGVVWSEQIIPLEDIERIEIMRGPGATVWGTNAVNGVINIVTRPAKETPGLVVSAGTGNQERSQGLVQYGGKLGPRSHYRAYVRYQDRGPAGELTSGPAHDSSQSTSGGFRSDTDITEKDQLTVEGQAFANHAGFDENRLEYTPPFVTPVVTLQDFSGQNLLASWTHRHISGARTNVQVSLAHIHELEAGELDQYGKVVSVAAQHEIKAGRHDLVAGVEYDLRSSRMGAAFDTVQLAGNAAQLTIAGGFVQDELQWAEGAFHLTVGLRTEHNSFSGLDFQPNVRLLWKVTSHQSFWTAYGLANRGAAPSDVLARVNVSVFPGSSGVQVVRYSGNPAIRSEKVHAFEAGYRSQPFTTFSLEMAAFYNLYYDLIGSAPGAPFFEPGPPPRAVLPLVAQNNVAGHSWGGELNARWLPRPWIRVNTAYSLLQMRLHDESPLATPTAMLLEGQSPRHQLYLGSSADLNRWLRLDSSAIFRDRLHFGNVPAYTLVDSRLTWHTHPAGEWSVGVKNMLNKKHVEFVSTQVGFPTQMGRSVYGQATWRF